MRDGAGDGRARRRVADGVLDEVGEELCEQADAPLIFQFLMLCTLLQHVRKAPTRFPGRHQVDEDRREEFAAVQCAVQAAAFAHQPRRVLHRIAQRKISQDARSGAMHGGVAVARELYYGTGGGKLFVRLEGVAAGTRFTIEFETGSVPTRSATGQHHSPLGSNHAGLPRHAGR